MALGELVKKISSNASVFTEGNGIFPWVLLIGECSSDGSLSKIRSGAVIYYETPLQVQVHLYACSTVIKKVLGSA